MRVGCVSAGQHAMSSIERLRTFDEWAALGYRVKKGQKSEARSADNVAMFSSDQVYKVVNAPVAAARNTRDDDDDTLLPTDTGWDK
jgi:hypothetical protein